MVSFHAPAPYSRGLDALTLSINSLIPDDIRVTKVSIAPPGFSARFSCVAKEYHYCVVGGKTHPQPARFRRACFETTQSEVSRRCWWRDASVLPSHADEWGCEQSLPADVCALHAPPPELGRDAGACASAPPPPLLVSKPCLASDTREADQIDLARSVGTQEAAISFEGVHNYSAFANITGSVTVRPLRAMQRLGTPNCDDPFA